MATTYATPGVYIEEITGPGVILGVGTSTAAFIGPTARGPMVPKRITTFDDFKRYYGREGDGWPYLFVDNRWYYMGHAVEGFFANGGTRAIILRVGTASAASWTLKNGAGDPVLTLDARQEGSAGNALSIDITETIGTTTPALAFVSASVIGMNDQRVEITYAGADTFVVGDTVELLPAPGAPKEIRVILKLSTDAQGKIFADLDKGWPTGAAAPTSIQIVDVQPEQARFRLKPPIGYVQAGSIIRANAGTAGAPDLHYAIVARVDSDGFVYLRPPLFQPAAGGTWTKPIPIKSGGSPTTVETSDFKLTVNKAGAELEKQDGLSLDPFHAGYIQSKTFTSITVRPSVPAPAPGAPPPSTPIANLRLATGPRLRTDGATDDLSKISLSTYKDALDTLKDVDDVNLVCIPDSANDVDIQKAALNHCETDMKDRIAVLDVPFDSEPDPDARAHSAKLASDSGFAALYYPWLLVPEPVEPSLPRPARPRPLPIPACGHIAGVMARTDEAFGVHYPPANTDVRGVMGLERVLSDREQGLINLDGVNALRIFPGEGRVIVWGARTTAPQTKTDWTYVNVRRLLLYIEESIQEGIRWAVFKPNDYPLWQSLRRSIGGFLDRVWKDGGLAGVKREQAYQVRIDEGLNPPDEIVLGRLHIEIRVAPVRPAEFIIVRIGLWDGGAQVEE